MLVLANVNGNVPGSPGRLAERTLLGCYHNCVVSCVIAWPGSSGLRPCTGPLCRKATGVLWNVHLMTSRVLAVILDGLGSIALGQTTLLQS